MIKTLNVQNFQAHKDSTLEFHPGVNIIKGTSYHGKSSIIRALRWLLTNRPQGFAFKSHFADENEDTIVAIATEEGSEISRIRGKVENGYVCEDIEYKALRGEVPEEVLSKFNTNEINLLTQHEPYFMLQDTAGERGRKLNSVVNLGIIDEVLGKAAGLIRKINSDIIDTTNKLEVKKEELQKFDFLEEKEILANEINSLLIEQEEISKKYFNLSVLIKDIEEVKKSKEDNELWLYIKKPYEELIILIPNNQKIKNKIEELNKLTYEIEKCTNKIKEDKNWLFIKNEYSILNKEIIFNKNLRVKITELFKLVHSIEKTKTIQNSAIQAVKTIKEQYDTMLKSNKICPLCGAKL